MSQNLANLNEHRLSIIHRQNSETHGRDSNNRTYENEIRRFKRWVMKTTTKNNSQ